MTFHVISVGQQCAQFFERTLRSIEEQSVDGWRCWIVYDRSDDDGAEQILRFVQDGDRLTDGRWRVQINPDRRFAVRNQAEVIRRADPADDDVIVWLDLDGDQFAHRDVLARLAEHYADGTLLTYGSYRPVPAVRTSQPAAPFPPEVIAAGSYREHTRTVSCCWNHLRSMSGRVAKAIPESHFKWARGPRRGHWYDGGTDYVWMTAGLELAGPRHKYIDEILCLYNHANDNADYLTRSKESSACTQDYLRRPPLQPLP